MRLVLIGFLSSLGALFLAAGNAVADDDLVTTYIVAEVPEGTGKVYITGSADNLGPWHPKGQEMYEDGTRRIYAFEAPEGFVLEYKFTKGSWRSEALSDTGAELASNYRAVAGEQEVYMHTIPGFKGRR